MRFVTVSRSDVFSAVNLLIFFLGLSNLINSKTLYFSHKPEYVMPDTSDLLLPSARAIIFYQDSMISRELSAKFTI